MQKNNDIYQDSMLTVISLVVLAVMILFSISLPVYYYIGQLQLS